MSFKPYRCVNRVCLALALTFAIAASTQAGSVQTAPIKGEAPQASTDLTPSGDAAKKLAEEQTPEADLPEAIPDASSDEHKSLNGWLVLVWLACAGGAGGFILGMRSPDSNAIRIPNHSEKEIQLGFIGDILTGAVSAIALLVASPALGIKVESTENADIFRLIGWGIVAGFAGRTLLPNLAKSLNTRVENNEKSTEELRRKQDLTEALLEARSEMEAGNYLTSQELYDKAIALSPKNRVAKRGKANVLAYRGKKDKDFKFLRQADEILTLLIQEDNSDASAVYNRAWVRALQAIVDKNIEKWTPLILADVGRSIELDASSRRWAREEFDLLMVVGDDDAFKVLVEPVADE